MYRPPPDEKKVGAFGFKASDFNSKVILVWPENRASVATFREMRNRWNVSMAGRESLDLSQLQYIWPLVRVRRRDRKRVVHDLMVMEDAALEAMRKD